MGRNPATGEAIRIKASKKARITPVKAFKDAVLAPATAPKLVKGAYPTGDAAVAAAGKSAAPAAAKKAPARAAAKKAPARKAAARKAPAKRTGEARQDSGQAGSRQEGREEVASKAGPLTRDRAPFSCCGPGPMDEPPARCGSGRSGGPTPRPLADRPLTEPHPDRLSPDDPAYPEIIRAHAEALRAGADTYVDPRSGLTVLTAGYLARRGYVLRIRVPPLPLRRPDATRTTPCRCPASSAPGGNRRRRSGHGMSDTSQGPGWWLASDGKWYPPSCGPGRPTRDWPGRRPNPRRRGRRTGRPSPRRPTGWPLRRSSARAPGSS